MPEEETLERAREDEREGKAAPTQAGEFVREEFHHIREGKHGARSPQQAIAIGLSKARRAGVNLPPPTRGRSSAKVRRQAERDYEKGRNQPRHQPSTQRSRATLGALKREIRRSASTGAISRQTRRRQKSRPRQAGLTSSTLVVFGSIPESDLLSASRFWPGQIALPVLSTGSLAGQKPHRGHAIPPHNSSREARHLVP